MTRLEITPAVFLNGTVSDQFTVTPQPVVFFGAPDPVNPSKQPGLVDLRQAAEYLDVSTRKLKDLCRDNRVTHSRIDYRTYRFSQVDIDAWIVAY